MKRLAAGSRRTILCLAATFLWATHDPDMVSGQSSELMEAYNSYNTLYQQGRYSEAEPYAKVALKLGTQEFGPSEPTTATFLNDLALIYNAQGRYAEAEPLYQRSLATLEKALGPQHPQVAPSLNNLALLYQAQGHYAQAEPLYKLALAIVKNDRQLLGGSSRSQIRRRVVLHQNSYGRFRLEAALQVSTK